MSTAAVANEKARRAAIGGRRTRGTVVGTTTLQNWSTGQTVFGGPACPPVAECPQRPLRNLDAIVTSQRLRRTAIEPTATQRLMATVQMRH